MLEIGGSIVVGDNVVEDDNVVEFGLENNWPQCKFCKGRPSLPSHHWCPQSGGNMTGLALAKDTNDSNNSSLANVILYGASGADWSLLKHSTASRNALLGFPNPLITVKVIQKQCGCNEPKETQKEFEGPLTPKVFPYQYPGRRK